MIDTKVTGEFASGFAKPGVKATAFADASRIVLHVANVQDRPAALQLRLGLAASTARRTRTTASESCVELPALPLEAGLGTDELPARAMVTYEVNR